MIRKCDLCKHSLGDSPRCIGCFGDFPNFEQVEFKAIIEDVGSSFMMIDPIIEAKLDEILRILKQKGEK